MSSAASTTDAASGGASGSAHHQARLVLGAPVSAKYRGAWCEGVIVGIKRDVSCKIQPDRSDENPLVVDIDYIKNARDGLSRGDNVTFKLPDAKRAQRGIVLRVIDNTRYTVRFPDDDERDVPSVMIKPQGPAHFEGKDTLGSFPLYNPETFSEPIKDGSSSRRNRSARASESESTELDDISDTHHERKRRTRRRNEADKSEDAESTNAPYPLAPRPPRNAHVVVLVDPCGHREKDSPWWPALVVPSDEVTNAMTLGQNFDEANQLVVRFFDDTCFSIVDMEDVRLMQPGTWPFEKFNQQASFRSHQAVQRALKFISNGELPSKMRWRTWDRRRDIFKAGSEETDRDSFFNQLADFRAKQNRPFRRKPSLGFKDIDLFALYQLVHARGDPESIDTEGWKEITTELGFADTHTASMCSAFFRHLDTFEWNTAAANDKEAKHKAQTSQQAVLKREQRPGDDDATIEVDLDDGYLFKEGETAFVAHADEWVAVKIIGRRSPGGFNQYRIHYKMWSKRYDTWIDEDAVRNHPDAARRVASRQSQTADSEASATKSGALRDHQRNNTSKDRDTKTSRRHRSTKPSKVDVDTTPRSREPEAEEPATSAITEQASKADSTSRSESEQSRPQSSRSASSQAKRRAEDDVEQPSKRAKVNDTQNEHFQNGHGIKTEPHDHVQSDEPMHMDTHPDSSTHGENDDKVKVCTTRKEEPTSISRRDQAEAAENASAAENSVCTDSKDSGCFAPACVRRCSSSISACNNGPQWHCYSRVCSRGLWEKHVRLPQMPSGKRWDDLPSEHKLEVLRRRFNEHMYFIRQLQQEEKRRKRDPAT